MPGKSEKIVLVGDTALAEIAYEYFTHDSCFEVAAFSVDQAYLKKETLFGKPVVPFETIEKEFPPEKFKLFVAVSYQQMNRLRARFCRQAKEKGYTLPSYVSSKAFVWRNVKLGENCFVFENNVIQPFVSVGDGVIFWSGNHIGHHSKIKDFVFVSSHVVVSGFTEVGAYSFLGVNSTIANNLVIAKDTLVGAGAVILRNTKEDRVYGASMTAPRGVGSLDHFKVKPFLR